MAKNPKGTLEENLDAKPPEIPEEAGGEGSPSLFDVSGEARVRILRKDERTQKWSTHGFFPAEVTEEDVAGEFGGGDYRAQLLVPDGMGREQIKRTTLFKVLGPYRQPVGELPGIGSRDPTRANGGTARPTAAGVSVGSMTEMLNATMLSSFMDMIKTMKDISVRPAPTTDPMVMEMLRQQATVQSKLIELMLANNNAPRGDSKKELLELMKEMKELVGPVPAAVPATNPSTMLGELVGAMKQLREVSDEFSPDKGSGDPMMDSLPKFAEILAEEQRQRRIAPTATGRVPKPGPLTAAQAPQLAGVDVPIWKRVLQREGPRLVKAAQENTSAEGVASAAVVFMPEQIKPAMREFFHRTLDEVVRDMCVELAPLAEHPQWLGEFVEHVQFLMFPEEFTEEGEVEDGNEKPETDEPTSYHGASDGDEARG